MKELGFLFFFFFFSIWFSLSDIHFSRYWIYSTNVGKYLIKFGDEKARSADIKEVFHLSPIWMMGVLYTFHGYYFIFILFVLFY